MIWTLVSWVTIVTCLGTVTAFLGRLGWLVELTVHFRAQSCVVLAICAALLAIKKRRLARLAAAGALVNAALVGPIYFRVAAPAASPESRAIRLLLSNVDVVNRNYEAVRALVRSTDPDVIVLVEVTKRWLDEVALLKRAYPVALEQGLGGRFGLAVYSRLPMERSDLRILTDVALPIARVRIMLDGQPLTIVAAHPIAPTTPFYAARRNRQLAELGRIVAALDGRVVVIGDLNVTPWSPYFHDLLRAGRLRDSRQGFGVQPSWPVIFLPMLIPIDHCLVSDGIAVRSRRIGPSVGSDHFPVIVEVSMANVGARQ